MQLDYASGDLNSGRLLQRSLLPQKLPEYPGLDIAAEVWTAVDLGGDYYQFLEQPGLLGVAIADSSGKSVAGAIHAALFKGQLDAYAAQGRLQNPVAVLNSLNQLLCNSQTEDAVALSYGVLDFGSYELRVGNAGIPGPIIYRANKGECEEIINPGLALGRLAGTTYHTSTRFIEEGDVAIFFSDGLCEAIDANGAEFATVGVKNSPLKQTIVALAHLNAAEILNGLKVALNHFSGQDIPEDDVSIVVIKLNHRVLLSQVRDCPYQEALQVWIRSEEQDESALLRGSRLTEAFAWAEGQSLSRVDREFLEASQRINEREQIQSERAASADRLEKLSQDLVKSLEAEKLHRLQAEMGEINERIVALTMSSEALYLSHNHIEALIASVIAGVQLRRLITQFSGRQISLKANTQTRAIAALEQVVYGIHEINRFEGHGYWVNGVSFSPDGKLLASGSSDRTVKIWKVNGTVLQTLQGHTNWVTGVSFSPDGTILATASRDNTVRLWRLNPSTGLFDQNPYQVLKGHEGPVLDVCFSPDGETIASASEDTTVKLWKLNGSPLKTMRGHERWVTCVAFSPSGKTVVSGSADRNLVIWSINGTLLKTLKGHDSFVESVCFAPGGVAIASCGRDKTVRLWDTEGTLVRTFYGHTDKVWGVSFSPDGSNIASAGWDRTIKIWHTDGTLLETLGGHGDVVHNVAFSPDGKTLASSSRDTTVKLWSIRGTPLKKLLDHTDEVNCVACSADGRFMATGSKDKDVKLWYANGNLLATLSGHNERIHCVAFSPDGNSLISASGDSSIKIWGTDGRLIDTLTGHRAEVYSVCFRPDGQVFASCSADGTIRIWRSDGTWLQTLTGHTAEVYSIAFSPDSSMLASASKDKVVNLWSWDGTLLYSFDGHSAEVFCVAFSPDSNMLATGSMDQSVKIWGVDGTLIKTLNGHSAEVRSVCFSPDGNALVSASEDTFVQFWSLDGTLLRTFSGHKATVKSVCFSPNNKVLISASADATVSMWNLDLDNLLMRGCTWLQQYLKSNMNVSDEDRHTCLSGCSWLYKFLKGGAEKKNVSQSKPAISDSQDLTEIQDSMGRPSLGQDETIMQSRV
jgi:WD40 repeat protein